MANFITFEKLAELPPIEGLIGGMINSRLHGEVRSAVLYLEQATADIPEQSTEQSVTVLANEQAVPTQTEDRRPLSPSEPEPADNTPITPEIPSNVISLDAARRAIEAIHKDTSLSFEVPDELKAA